MKFVLFSCSANISAASDSGGASRKSSEVLSKASSDSTSRRKSSSAPQYFLEKDSRSIFGISNFALGILITVSMACSFSFSTANLSDLKLGKDKNASGASTTFNPNDEIFAVTSVNNSMSKTKVRFRLLFDKVQGAQSGAVAYKLDKEMDVEDSRPVWFNFSVPTGFVPGSYKVESVLTDENGKEFDRKNAGFTVADDASSKTMKPVADENHDKDSDDK